MRKRKRIIASVLSVSMVVSLCACQNSSGNSLTSTGNLVTENPSTESEGNSAILSSYVQDSASLSVDNTVWNYDEEHDVYWQINMGYCSEPETTDYETMGIYIPGQYMTGVANNDGTYTCTINTGGTVSGYTAETAPIVFPVNTAGYSAQAAPTSYSYDSISEYLEAGFIYVYAGMRGRSNGYDESGNLIYSGGAPWGVTDLKAAVRYYRYNSSLLPGDTENIFVFGYSGGGAQSAIMGATGDSELYYSYLTSIGAAMYDVDGNYISDEISGVMSWCPITSLDYADEAYEWNMGQYSSEGTRSDDTFTSALSDDLATAYAEYINELGLIDKEGNVLTLDSTSEGIYTSGTYYSYILSVIEESLNNFLSDTSFPYTESGNVTMGDGGFGGSGKDSQGGTNVPSGGMPSGDMPSGDMPSGDMPSGDMPSGDMPGGDSSSATGTTYETAQEYIDSLNSDGEWITYDASTNTATITSIGDFVSHCKKPSKDVAAFDDLNCGQAENMLFGNDESDAMHFDAVLASLLEANQEKYAAFSDWNSSYVTAYSDALTATDKLSTSSEVRQNMYNPMYFISEYYEGYGTSHVASHWRINTGIEQGDTALTVESNLALALEQCEGVEDVQFTTVWGQGHTTAERSGDSTTNFISWVNDCIK